MKRICNSWNILIKQLKKTVELRLFNKTVLMKQFNFMMLSVMFHLRILHSLTIDGNSHQDAVNTRNDSQHNAFAQLATVYF